MLSTRNPDVHLSRDSQAQDSRCSVIDAVQDGYRCGEAAPGSLGFGGLRWGAGCCPMGQLGTQTFTFSRVARAKAPVVTDSVGYGCLYMMSLKVQIIFILNYAQLITLFIYLSIYCWSLQLWKLFKKLSPISWAWSSSTAVFFQILFYIKYLHIPPISINFFIIWRGAY